MDQRQNYDIVHRNDESIVIHATTASKSMS